MARPPRWVEDEKMTPQKALALLVLALIAIGVLYEILWYALDKTYRN